MTGRRLFIVLMLTTLWACSAFGLSVTSSVDITEIELGDPITLSISVSGDGASAPDPILPNLSDFEVYSSGKNTSISIINGRFSSTLEITYVLVPKKIGTLTIGSVKVKEKQNKASSSPIRIEVKKPGKIIPSTRPRQKTAKTPQRTENFFIEQSVDNKRPYIGEQVTLTFRFYQAENLWEQPSLVWPEFGGFTIEDLPPNKRSNKIINGKQYRVTEIKRALFPITAGEIVIGSPRLVIKDDVFDSFRDPFNMFGRNRRRKRPTGPKELTAKPLTLTVRPLPVKGKPGNFAGAVGKYRIRVATDKDSVGVDEPITMKVTLSGVGNIKSLPALSLPDMPDFRVYESGKTESINNSGGTVSGSKTFEQAVLPVTSGQFQIPVIAFSYFNPEKGRYRTIKTKPIDIIASGGELADLGGGPQNIIEPGNESFAYIITEFSEPEKSMELYDSFWFWLLQIIPVLGMVATIVLRTHYRKIVGDQGYARRFAAAKRSKAAMKSAGQKKSAGNFAGFYADLYAAVVGFIADRLNLEISAMIVDDIKKINKIDAETKADLTNFINKCHAAQFAPSAIGVADVDEEAKKAMQLLQKLGKMI